MTTPRRDRKRRPARRTSLKKPKPLFLVICEGRNTEPQYVKGYQEAFKNPRVQIVVAPESGVPKTLVGIAKKYKNEAKAAARSEGDDNLIYDSIWCVFDVDDHPNIPDAICMARDNGIQLAISNPCFELWLLLHFRESPGMKHRSHVVNLLKKYVPNYDKKIEITRYIGGFSEAEARAEKLDRAAEAAREPGRNPTTGVFRLTKLIRGDDSRA